MSKNWKVDRVNPEPPKPKTEKFTFADADFLLGLEVRDSDLAWIGYNIFGR